MSPEQARGRSVDARTDLWAFGCVLYEMLTGEQPFKGDGLAEVLAAVIGTEPDWTALPSDTPAELQRCLRRCLQKDPRQRFHHIGDVRLAMEGAFEPTPDEGTSSPGRLRRSARIAWTAAALAIAAAVATPLLTNRTATPASPQAPAAPTEVPAVPSPSQVVGGNVAAPPVQTPPSTPATQKMPDKVVQGAPPILLFPRTGGGGTGTAATIQEAIEKVGVGGTVTVLPGTYAESLKITKGVTLQATGERSGAAILAPPDKPEIAIEILTSEPVIIRGFTIHVTGRWGIRASGAVDLTVERSTVVAGNPERATTLIQVANDGTVAGTRARALIRRNLLEGGVTKLPRGVARPNTYGVSLAGDTDALIEGNTVRQFGGICIQVGPGPRHDGHVKVDILENEIDECHSESRLSAIKVGVGSVLNISPKDVITATGTVNVVGNTIRNSSEDCISAAIVWDTFGGRIERNRIVNFLQPCALGTTRNAPAAIWLGLGLQGNLRIPAVAPTVRFNDIVGNARAGLGIGSNVAVQVDATCNFWGSESGPSGAGPGQGDSIYVREGGTMPLFLPFATAPIARSKATGC
jgi:hypothetical protein